jgi:hypothetical protein
MSGTPSPSLSHAAGRHVRDAIPVAVHVGERAGVLFAVDALILQPVSAGVQIDDQVIWSFAGPSSAPAVGHTIEPFTFVLADLERGDVLHRGPMDLAPQIGDLSPDGERFAVTGLEGEVRVLNTTNGQWTGPSVQGHDGVAGCGRVLPRRPRPCHRRD